MNRSFLLGYVAVLVLAQVYGFLVHELMLGATYERLAAAFRPEAEMRSMMWIMLVGSAVSLLLFCYIFTKGYENRGLGEGLRYGLLMGLFATIPYALDQYVVYPVTAFLTSMWLLSGLVMFALLGVVFSAIYRPRA